MAKRTLEDADIVNGDLSAKENRPATKKSRKESKKAKVDESADQETIVGEVDVDAEKAARKEKKRLNKSKKLQKAEAEAEANSTGTETPKEDSKSDDLGAKAAKKAEKSRLKALKKAKKTEKESSGDSTPLEVEAPVVNGKSNGVAKINGSADNGYTEDAELTALPQSEIDSFLAEHFISITDPLSPTNTLRPITKFSYLPIPDPAHRAPFKNFKAPTPIQAAAWPPVQRKGRDWSCRDWFRQNYGFRSTMCTRHTLFTREAEE